MLLLSGEVASESGPPVAMGGLGVVESVAKGAGTSANRNERYAV
jgi:hypothetical protein